MSLKNVMLLPIGNTMPYRDHYHRCDTEGVIPWKMYTRQEYPTRQRGGKDKEPGP